ncbi:MAG: crossover junction endodeoxyribonuclease RuvC [Planctomycetia bacterium]|nr:crossover junction endodeoxyribonuclease RuvC [Planctomycetia bacterium]
MSTSAPTPHAPPAVRVMGVDPGLRVTGYSIIETRPRGPHICEAGVIRTMEGTKTTDLGKRISVLYNGIVEVVDQYHPQTMVVEQLFAHYDHPRTAILMAHARGVILLAAAQRRIPVVSYTAPRIKKSITGSGRATKEQMQHAIRRELNLTKLPEPHDVADALAAALCHYCQTRLMGKGVPGRAGWVNAPEESGH